MTPKQRVRENIFNLISKQAQNAVKLADEGFGGTTNPHMAACHLLGIAAYIKELAGTLKNQLEIEE